MNPVKWSFVGLMALGLSGCGGPSPTEVRNIDRVVDIPDTRPIDYSSSDLSLHGARIEGQLGRFSANGDAHGWVDMWDEIIFADVRARGEGVLMAGIEFGNIDFQQVAKGDVFKGGVAHNPNYDFPENEAYVTMVSCAGALEDEWEEDVPADEVEVEVVAVTNEQVTLQFTGVLLDDSGVVKGQMTFDIPR